MLMDSTGEDRDITRSKTTEELLNYGVIAERKMTICME